MKCKLCGGEFQVKPGTPGRRPTICPQCRDGPDVIQMPSNGHFYVRKKVIHDGPQCPCGCGRPRRRFSNGRLSKWHNRKCAKSGYKVTSCPICGVETRASRGRKGYCAFHQGQVGGRKGGRTPRKTTLVGPKHTHVYGVRLGARSWVTFDPCALCGGEIRNGPGKSKKLFCSKECLITAKSQQRSNVDNPVKCITCGTIFNRFYSPWVGAVKTCSAECEESAKKAAKRKYKAMRRAAKKSAGPHSRFDPFDVFRRDRWQCQACGVDTPEELRGTYEDSAPELDHIIPVSKGGLHTIENCQCLCRACNQAKSDLNNMVFLKTSKFSEVSYGR